MFTIAICDDNLADINIIKQNYLELNFNSNLFEFIEFTSPDEFIAALPQIKYLDILLLDMYMPDYCGHIVAEQFRKHFPKAYLVFISNFPLPSLDDYKFFPAGYIDKKDISASLLRILARFLSEKMISTINVHKGTSDILINIKDILYISKDHGHAVINLSPSARDYSLYHPLKCKESYEELCKRVEKFPFSAPHNSYCVNLQQIKKIDGNDITLSNNERLTVSRSHRFYFRRAYTSYLNSI